jgi:hypothetical protein
MRAPRPKMRAAARFLLGLLQVLVGRLVRKPGCLSRTTVGRFRLKVPRASGRSAYVRELEPAVTSGLCASKAPKTSSFSRGGTLKCSSVSASTAAT